MLSVSIKHPDSESFIDAKMESGKITGANVSVKIHDDFMESALSNKPYIQQYPTQSENPWYKKKLMPMRYGKKSFTMHGNRLNREFFSGIQLYANRFLIVMPI